MEVNKGIIPPYGFHYPIDTGVVLHAATADLLFKQIIEYRMRLGRDPGDPKKDFDDYICSRWPHACRQTERDGAPESERRKGLGGRVSAWAAETLLRQPSGGYELVGEDEAETRGNKCASCPYNKPWVNCSSCARSAQAILLQIRKLRQLKVDSSLFGCEVCGHDNATAIHIKDYRVSDEVRNGLPQNCWMVQK